MSKRRSVVVTGAGAGIGRAVIDRLRTEDWQVVGVESSVDAAQQLADALGREGDVVVGDVRERAALERAGARASEIGVLAGWVNNAAINRPTTLHEPVESDVEDILAVNLLACYWGSSIAIRYFLEQKSHGSLVSISSIHARSSYPAAAAYDVTKAGVEALMRYVAVEYGPVGIRANSVAPAAVATPMSRARLDASPDPSSMESKISASVPLRRIAAAEEVAAVVAFLVSDDASYVSGQSIGVDGAMSATCMPHETDPGLLDGGSGNLNQGLITHVDAASANRDDKKTDAIEERDSKWKA